MLKRKNIFAVALALVSVSTSAGRGVYAQSEDTDGNRPIKDKWAVIIGVGDFASPRIPKLRYPAKDAQDFYDFLVTKGNFRKDHILLLKDSQATRDHIVDALGENWLPRRVMKDDLVVIFMSSHGSPADSAGDNFIIAYDTDPNRSYATGIRFQDLAHEVTKRTGCDRLVLLLDACHSGAAVESEGGKGLVRATNFDLNSITGSGQLVISSSSPAQTSWESKRYPNGVFTRKLIDAMQVNGPNTHISDAYKALKDGVEQEVRFDRVSEQTPMILSKWKGQDLALCAAPAEPRVVLPQLQADDAAFTSPRNNVGQVNVSAAPSTVRAQVENPVKVSIAPPFNPASIQRNAFSPNGVSHSVLNSVPASNAGGGVMPAAGPMMTTSWNDGGGDATLESGTRLISESELQGLNYQQLEFLYNEAYARHGRGFLTPKIQQYFNSQSWYRPDPDYHWRANDPRVIARKSSDDALVVNAKRTPKQWANMQLIKRVMDRSKH